MRYIRKKAHVKAAEDWIAVMEDRLQDIPMREQGKPLPAALTETGWTVDPYTRRRAHWFHSGGNRLMAFVDAVSRHIFGDDLHMRFVVVMDVVESHLAYAAEHAVSRLASSYVTCTGFNTTWAGASVHSALTTRGIAWEAQLRRVGKDIAQSVEREHQVVMARRDKLAYVQATQRKQKDIEKMSVAEVDLKKAAQQAEEERRDVVAGADDAFAAWAESVCAEAAALQEAESLGEVADEMVEILTRLMSRADAH